MSLKIGVLVKYVPDSSAKIQLKDAQVDWSSIKWTVNPYDEFAVEEALRTQEAWKKEGKQVETVAIVLGPKAWRKALTDVLAVGIDRGIHILDESGSAQDPRSISEALAKVCQEEAFHLIFAGKQAIDTDSHATAVMVAERLSWPHIGVVSKIEWQGQDQARVERDAEGGVKEVYQVKMPALLTCNKGLNKMRLASFINIRKAAQKPVTEKELSPVKPAWKVSDWQLPAERGQVKILEGASAEEKVEKLLKALREEAKVI